MEKITIKIISQDVNYGETLGRFISSSYGEFQISVEKPEEDSGCAADYITMIVDGKEHVVKLTEGYQPPRQDVTGEPVKLAEVPDIYKYGCLSEIVKDLRYMYGTIRGRPMSAEIKEGRTKFICGLGASGGAGTTSLLIGLGRELSAYRGKKVLYLSFEEFESVGNMLKLKWNERDLNQYLYYFFHRKKELAVSFQDSFLNEDECGLRMFTPAKGRNGLRDMTSEEIEVFLGHVSEYGGFDYVLVDMPWDGREEARYILERCGTVLMIFQDEPVSQGKAGMLIEYLSEDFLHHCMEKIIIINNKCKVKYSANSAEYWRTEKTKMEESSDENNTDLTNHSDKVNETLESSGKESRASIYKPDCEILYDEGSFLKSEDGVELSIENVFGLGVKKIGDMLVSH